MIVISKKRLITLVGLVCTTLFVSSLTFNMSNIDKDINSRSLETMALPITNKVIVIDAGHGIPDERS